MVLRLPVIGVFGSGSEISEEETKRAHAVGRLVARLGAHLLTGGGVGAMKAAAEGYTAVRGRKGISIGVIPCKREGDFSSRRAGYPNEFVELPIYIPLVSTVDEGDEWRTKPNRNHVNVLTVHAAIILPGSAGTENEMIMAEHYFKKRRATAARRRTVLFGATFFPERKNLIRKKSIKDLEKHLRGLLKLGPPDARR